MSRRALSALLAVLAAVALAAPASALAQRDELPLGPRWLPETRSTASVGAGVRWTSIVRGRPSPADRWVVDVEVQRVRRVAAGRAAAVRAAGFDARLERFAGPLAGPRPRGDRVVVVRSGAFATQAQADSRRAALVAAGFTGARSVFTAEDGTRTTGPWRVDVLELSARAVRERLAPVLANDVVVDRETTSAIAARTGAAAAVNGGYFVIGGPGDGDPAGAYALDGELISETIDGRTTLVLSAAGARFAALGFAGSATLVGAGTRAVDGIDRIRGEIRNCGGRGGDVRPDGTPTETPRHDTTCTDPSELVVYTPAFGSSTRAPAGGLEAVVRDGVVTELTEAGDTPIPPGGSVLSGSGDAAEFLRAGAAPGARPQLDLGLRSAGAPFALAPGTAVVNGGPRLLLGGRTWIPSAEEGFVYQDDPGFSYRFAMRRNPRTLAGVRSDGTLVLVTVDGRRPGVSAGASFLESADILSALGAREGLNLDGGGSTTMVVGGRVVNLPSDATGERPVSDALTVRP